MQRDYLSCNYDERHDVLYIALGDRNNSYGDDENGLIFLKDMDTDEFTGITILSFMRKYREQTLPCLPPQCSFSYEDLRKHILN